MKRIKKRLREWWYGASEETLAFMDNIVRLSEAEVERHLLSDMGDQQLLDRFASREWRCPAAELTVSWGVSPLLGVKVCVGEGLEVPTSCAVDRFLSLHFHGLENQMREPHRLARRTALAAETVRATAAMEKNI